MRSELWPHLPGFQQNEPEERGLPALIANRQLEAVRKQSLHHESKLILGRIAGCVRLDVISIAIRPFRQLRLQGLNLARRWLVCKNYVLEQPNTRHRQQSPGRSESILRPKGYVSVRRGNGRVGRVLLDGGNV